MRIQRLLPVLIILFVMSAGQLSIPAQQQVRVLVGGRPLLSDPPAIVVRGRLLVSLRALAEYLGASVAWRADSRTTLVRAESARVTVTIDARQASVDGRTVPLEVAPTLREGRVFVPLRFLAEALGADVRWEAGTAVVTPARPLPLPTDGATIIVFFYVANQTGAEIRIRAWANGRELFDQRLPATATPTPGIVPPPPPYPVMELKVSIPRASRTLEVHEDLVLRARRTFSIVGFDRSGAGFRVLITPDGIRLSQDYRPIR